MDDVFDALIEAASWDGYYPFAGVRKVLESYSWAYRSEFEGANSKIFTHSNSDDGVELMKVFPHVALVENQKLTFEKKVELAGFRREVSAYRKCREHDLSGFPVYIDEGTLMGRFFLIMPYIDGDNLEQAIQKKDFSPKDVEKYLPKLARDVGGAHSIELIHRDLKPANLIVGSDGFVVVDLGLMINSVKALDSYFTKCLIAGTPGNMAPEQIAKIPPTFSSDVYALGTVMYHIYAGRNPFTVCANYNSVEIMTRQLSGEIEPLADVADVSVELNDLVMRCLRINPFKRYANGIALSRALEEVL